MFWHYLKEVAVVLVAIHGMHSLLNFRHSGKAGEFRRIWNWPMRIAVMCWLSAGVLGCLGAWIGKQPSGGAIGNSLVSATIFAVMAGMVSLFVFLGGFFVTMIRDFQPHNRPAPPEDNIDKVQTLLLNGKKQDAVLLYQMQNNVNSQEAEETVEAIDAALQVGLRV